MPRQPLGCLVGTQGIGPRLQPVDGSMQQTIANNPQRRLTDSVRLGDGIDPATGVAKRAFLRQRLEQDWSRAQRNQQRLNVLMLSIDHFRECDSKAAQHCKQVVAEIIAAHCRRRADFLGHLRDHEFAVLLSDATRQGAQAIAESICRAVEARHVRPTAAHWSLTVSVGIGSMVPRATRFVDSLLIAADAGLRKARRLGGNTVQISTKLR
jgi:diguanylate cyclase (GGDEF)-like protein